MAQVTKPYTLSSGGQIKASEHNSNYDTIYNEFNGNIDNDNIKAGAGIVASKLDLSSMPVIGASAANSGSFTSLTVDSISNNIKTYSSIIFSTANLTQNDSVTRYIGMGSLQTTLGLGEAVMPFGCTITNMFTASGDGTTGTRTFHLMVNGTATTLTCLATATKYSNDTNSAHAVSVSVGDRLLIRNATSGGTQPEISSVSVRVYG